MSEQPAGGQTDMLVVSPPETWTSLGDLSQRTGIHRDTIRSAIKEARKRQEPWVKMAPTEDFQDGRNVLWINTASPEYQRLAARWKARAARLRSRARSTPLTRSAHAHRAVTKPADLLLNSSHNVLAAFDTLIEKLEGTLQSIHQAGANALETGDYERTHTTIEQARHVLLVHEQIAALKQEWKDFEKVLSTDANSEQPTPQGVSVQRLAAQPNVVVRKAAPQPVGQRVAGKMRKELHIPSPAFYRPILQALSDLGGSAKRKDVLGALEQSLRDVLKPIDEQSPSSEAGQVQWQISAQSAHSRMMKEGLLRTKSPFGIWEITDKGRAWLVENDAPKT